MVLDRGSEEGRGKGREGGRERWWGWEIGGGMCVCVQREGNKKRIDVDRERKGRKIKKKTSVMFYFRHCRENKTQKINKIK